MTVSENELRGLFGRALGAPKGPARTAALDAVLRTADAAGHDQQAFELRVRAISTFHHDGDPTRAFLAFSRCLAVWDRRPEWVTSRFEHSLLWAYKWMVWALPQFPEIPAERARTLLDDMERRYLLAGYGLHAVHQHRWLMADHIGDTGEAARWYGKMIVTARDAMSDCSSCVPSSEVRHLTTIGEYEQAVERGTPYTDGGCTEQPQWMLSELLPAYLATGRLDEAAVAFRTGYERMRGDRHHLDNIAQHLLFLGRTGNEARGLELVARHLPWLEAPSSPYAAMEFASAAANVLGRLSAGGHGAISVQRRGDDGSFREPSTVDAVREEMVALATGIAARFDARNATTRQSDRTRARIGAEAVGDAPLTVLGGRGREREAPEITALVDAVTAANADPRSTGPAKLALIAALDTAGRHADAVEVAEEAMSGFGRLGLTPELQRCGLALAELYGHLRRTTDAVRVLDELLAADDGTLPRSRVLCRIADLTPMSAARQLAAADDRAATGDGREAHYLLRAIRFGGCGDDDLRKTAVDRLVPLVVGIDDAELRNEARWTLAMARHDERDLDDACRLLREMLSDGVEALFRQACLDHLASYLTELGRFEEAMEVVTDWAAVDGEDGLEGKLHVLRILRRQGREDEALRQEEEWGIDPKEFEGG